MGRLSEGNSASLGKALPETTDAKTSDLGNSTDACYAACLGWVAVITVQLEYDNTIM